MHYRDAKTKLMYRKVSRSGLAIDSAQKAYYKKNVSEHAAEHFHHKPYTDIIGKGEQNDQER